MGIAGKTILIKNLCAQKVAHKGDANINSSF